MNEQLYDNEILTEYLLGALPATEAENFDELSFTDETFAEQLKSAENNLIDAYLQNELAGDTLEKFKSFYLASPLRREKVIFAKTLQDFAARNLPEVNKENITVPIAEPALKSGGFLAALNNFIKLSSLSRGFAVAAGLILLTFGGLWIFNVFSNRQTTEIARQGESQQTNPPGAVPTGNPERNSGVDNRNETNVRPDNIQPDNIQPAQTPSQTPLPNPLPEKSPVSVPTIPTQTPKPQRPPAANPVIASLILAAPLRGSNQIQSVSLAGKVTDLAIRLELDAADYATYRVVLTDQASGENLLTIRKLKAISDGGNKALNLRLPARILKSGVYALSVSGTSRQGQNEIIGDYPFRVVIK